MLTNHSIGVTKTWSWKHLNSDIPIFAGRPAGTIDIAGTIENWNRPQNLNQNKGVSRATKSFVLYGVILVVHRENLH